MNDNLPNDSDGDALSRLIATGSDLTKKMEIDFAVHVRDRDTGLVFAKAVESQGFRPAVDQDEKSGRWTCYCSRTMVPSYDALVDLQDMLEELGRPYGAFPDGWGSFGNDPNSPAR
jgi:Regulator of ribonuclease activity B